MNFYVMARPFAFSCLIPRPVQTQKPFGGGAIKIFMIFIVACSLMFAASCDPMDRVVVVNSFDSDVILQRRGSNVTIECPASSSCTWLTKFSEHEVLDYEVTTKAGSRLGTLRLTAQLLRDHKLDKVDESIVLLSPKTLTK